MFVHFLRVYMVWSRHQCDDIKSSILLWRSKDTIRLFLTILFLFRYFQMMIVSYYCFMSMICLSLAKILEEFPSRSNIWVNPLLWKTWGQRNRILVFIFIVTEWPRSYIYHKSSLLRRCFSCSTWIDLKLLVLLLLPILS